jgi:hypothetical protein
VLKNYNRKYVVIYTSNAIQRLEGFLVFIRENCIYLNTGLQEEIVEWYIKRFDDFIDKVLDQIEHWFENGSLLLWRKIEIKTENIEVSKQVVSIKWYSLKVIITFELNLLDKIINILDITIKS